MRQTAPGNLRVRLRERGGVTGVITTTTEVTSSDLPEAAQKELHELVGDLPPTEGAAAGDHYGSTYELEVEGEGGSRTFTFNGKNMPDKHRQVIRWLKRCQAAKRSTA